MNAPLTSDELLDELTKLLHEWRDGLWSDHDAINEVLAVWRLTQEETKS